MPDREKVVKGLEQFRADLKPFCGNHADWERFDAALAMLKEQEPAEPVMKKGRLFTVPTCRKCGYFFATGTKPNYCSNCGQAVKWE